ncbi:MAG: LysR family transcriptional regulator, partial [Oscillospiraceae bacterium]|nr:LysR family transcriptional regulator [Oscillospiraceae bacterium]
MHRQMRYFIAVVETNSFFEAGEVCHISQSAISQQIKALEDELQVQLLERHGRKFTVTPAGQYFYEQAKRQTA